MRRKLNQGRFYVSERQFVRLRKRVAFITVEQPQSIETFVIKLVMDISREIFANIGFGHAYFVSPRLSETVEVLAEQAVGITVEQDETPKERKGR